MNIRKMTIYDYQPVYDLWMACDGVGLNDIDDSRQGIERFLKRNPKTCFVTEEDGKVVGVIMAGHDGRRGFIYHAAVDPAYRRQKIGHNLVNRALEAIRNEGIAKVALVVFNDNDAANKFWEKQGFDMRGDLVYRNKPLMDLKKVKQEAI